MLSSDIDKILDDLLSHTLGKLVNTATLKREGEILEILIQCIKEERSTNPQSEAILRTVTDNFAAKIKPSQEDLGT